MIFELTIDLVRFIEQWCITGQTKKEVNEVEWLLTGWKRWLFNPFRSLRRGATIVLRPFSVSIGAFLLTYVLFGFAFFGSSHAVPDTVSLLFFAVLVCAISIGCGFLAMPGSYSSAGVSPALVGAVTAFLRKEGVASEVTLDAVEKQLEVLEETPRGRIQRLRWVVAVVWGINIYWLQKRFDLLSSSGLEAQSFLGLVPFMARGIAVTALLHLVVESYGAFNSLVFRGIRLGIHELRAELKDAAAYTRVVESTQQRKLQTSWRGRFLRVFRPEQEQVVMGCGPDTDRNRLTQTSPPNEGAAGDQGPFRSPQS